MNNSSSSSGDRSSQFKNRGAMRPDDLRRRRDEFHVELRRQTRLENLSKRRTLDSQADSRSSSQASGSCNNLASSNEPSCNTDEIIRFVGGIFSEDVRAQYESIVQVRKIISRENDPPIQAVIDCGIVPRLVSFLSSTCTNLQFEAAWALTNVASGNSAQTAAVIQSGAVPVLVQLLNSNNIDICEQAIWALGNVAGESPVCRDLVLSSGVLKELIRLVDGFDSDRMSFLRTAAWALDNLCRGKQPQPPWETIRDCLPTLARLVYSNDKCILADVCWALSYLSDGVNDRLQAVLDCGITRRLVELLSHQEIIVVTPALRTIGNIVTGNDLQTQVVLNCSALPALQRLLYSSDEHILKEACWAISNITAGSHDQVRAVMESGLMPRVINILESGDYKSRREACWALSNAIACLTPEDPAILTYLVEHGAIKALCSILDVQDMRVVNISLDALDTVLRAGETMTAPQLGNGGSLVNGGNYDGRSPFVLAVEAANGLGKLNDLLNIENRQITQKVNHVLDTYFSNSDDMSLNDFANGHLTSNGGEDNAKNGSAAAFHFTALDGL